MWPHRCWTIAAILLGAVCRGRAVGDGPAAGPKPNVLLITLDDMSAESVGAFGCRLAGTTPTIDALAARGVRFHHAHVVAANCMPSRNAMWSGLYPHRSGVEGFYAVPDAKYPHLVDLMKAAGYFTGIRGKITHSTPYAPYGWDAELETMPDGTRVHPKNAKSYGHSMAEGIRLAKAAGRPFCLMMNIADPHKPFYAQGNNSDTVPDANVPSRVFTPDEVPVPGFLFDDPVVRKELSHYYSSVRRADDGVAEILAAVRAAGEETNTLVVFLSDRGMPLPFSKTQLYHDSTRTPLIFSWPGVLPRGKVDDRHVVSAVDLLPTLLESLGIRHPGAMDGRSFAGLLRGEVEPTRQWIAKEHNENASGARNPMRAIQGLEYLYIFNPWANGTRTMATATLGTPTYRRMRELAANDRAIAARHELFLHRVLEEFYHVATDPDCRHNRIGDPSAGEALERARRRLAEWLAATGDDMAEVFQHRDDAAVREAYMTRKAQESAKRRAAGEKKTRSRPVSRIDSDPSTGARPRRERAAAEAPIIALEVPNAIEAGRSVTVRIRHNSPESDAPEILTVTMKDGGSGRQIERKSVTARGVGVTDIVFDVPVGLDATVRFAAFVGRKFPGTPAFVQSAPVAVGAQ